MAGEGRERCEAQDGRPADEPPDARSADGDDERSGRNEGRSRTHEPCGAPGGRAQEEAGVLRPGDERVAKLDELAMEDEHEREREERRAQGRLAAGGRAEPIMRPLGRDTDPRQD
jgi:hypothetical protein